MKNNESLNISMDKFDPVRLDTLTLIKHTFYFSCHYIYIIKYAIEVANLIYDYSLLTACTAHVNEMQTFYSST